MAKEKESNETSHTKKEKTQIMKGEIKTTLIESVDIETLNDKINTWLNWHINNSILPETKELICISHAHTAFSGYTAIITYKILEA